MEAPRHHLSFYQAQYQPSFDADQQKIDDYLNLGADSLNTPNIDPDFFNETNLFSNEKVHMKAIKIDPLVDDYIFTNDINLNTQANVNPIATTSYDRSTYSPQQLESSQIINVNSPEMMPVSPNKVCPSYAIEDDITLQNQMVGYENTIAMYNSPFVSTCNSRSSSISSGSGDNVNYEYMFSSVDQMVSDNSASLCRVPPSPASTSSHYTSESSKTFINLDNAAQSLGQVQIKQEPIDSLYQPTVIEELESNQMFISQPQLATSYSTLNVADLAATQYQYQYSTVNSNTLPSTVANVILQQQQPLQPSGPTTPTGGNRKRNVAAAFSVASTSAGSSGTSSTKKPRMTKREKQKMMEGDISKFENENRDLKTSIDLLERQIAFCKRFLSENVAPVIQRQQQMGSQFGSPMMVAVSEM